MTVQIVRLKDGFDVVSHTEYLDGATGKSRSRRRANNSDEDGEDFGNKATNKDEKSNFLGIKEKSQPRRKASSRAAKRRRKDDYYDEEDYDDEDSSDRGSHRGSRRRGGGRRHSSDSDSGKRRRSKQKGSDSDSLYSGDEYKSELKTPNTS